MSPTPDREALSLSWAVYTNYQQYPYRLVGWKDLISDQTTKPQLTPPSSGTINVVTVIWANIRSDPGFEFPVVKEVKQGEKLTIIGEHGEWFNVRLEDGKEGWINRRVVKQK